MSAPGVEQVTADEATLHFAGPQGADLRRRVLQTTAEARELLELSVEGTAHADPAQIPELVAGLRDLLANSGQGGAEPLVREHEAALDRLRHRFDTRFDALARAGDAVKRLRETTSPAAMLARAPAALCQSSKLERALLSLVSGGRMVAEAAYQRQVADELIPEHLRWAFTDDEW